MKCNPSGCKRNVRTGFTHKGIWISCHLVSFLEIQLIQGGHFGQQVGLVGDSHTTIMYGVILRIDNCDAGPFRGALF